VDAAIDMWGDKVDLARLAFDVLSYLKKLPATGGEPRPNPDLLRVLARANQAAKDSGRYETYAALVIAAIVGDGMSPAARLLKAHGLNVEQAIQTLRRLSSRRSVG
jgi:hypothetical protein